MPSQHSPKLASFARSSGSRNTHRATRNCKVGPMYCRNPIADNGNRRNAAPNNSSGTAVNTPESESSHQVSEDIPDEGSAASAIADGKEQRGLDQQPVQRVDVHRLAH